MHPDSVSGRSPDPSIPNFAFGWLLSFSAASHFLLLVIFSSQLSAAGIDVASQGSADRGCHTAFFQDFLEFRHGSFAAGFQRTFFHMV
jgi:hypothetical protein